MFPGASVSCDPPTASPGDRNSEASSISADDDHVEQPPPQVQMEGLIIQLAVAVSHFPHSDLLLLFLSEQVPAFQLTLNNDGHLFVVHIKSFFEQVYELVWLNLGSTSL